MPKVSKGSKYTKRYSQEQLENAIKAVKEGKSQREACIQYGIPRGTLQFRMSESFVKDTPGPLPVLGLELEEKLCKWLIECRERGFPIRKETLQASVKNYLDDNPQKNPFNGNVPGDGWYKSFLKRNPQITERTSEGISRANSCVLEQNLRSWFDRIHLFLSKENYLSILENPSRIFNSEETYFSVCPKTKTVLAPGAQSVYEIESGCPKLNLTVLFTFSASGLTIPPTIVFPYKRLPDAVRRSVPGHWGIGVKPTGCMNDDLFAEYIKNMFYPHLIREKIELPVILYVDGHSSHITMKISKLCSELQIILLCLYPNAKQILQPADVLAFKPLKNMWKKSLLKWRQQNPTQMVMLENMAPILLDAVNNFSQNGKAITNGFTASGLYPWNPNAIDYSKCHTKKSSIATEKSSTETVQSKNFNCLNVKAFINITGSDLYNELKSYTLDSKRDFEKSREFIALKKILNNLENTELCTRVDPNESTFVEQMRFVSEVTELWDQV